MPESPPSHPQVWENISHQTKKALSELLKILNESMEQLKKAEKKYFKDKMNIEKEQRVKCSAVTYNRKWIANLALIKAR